MSLASNSSGRDSRLRKRPTAGPSNIGHYDTEDDHVTSIYTRPVRHNFPHLLTHPSFKMSFQRDRSAIEKILDTDRASYAVAGVLTALAFALRFYKINHPDQVV
jgi:dolichyl-phosphate-mannose-protein mannosyltransferase